MRPYFDNIDIDDSPVNGGISATNITSLPGGDFPDFPELPEGLAMAFAQDTAALRRFTNLSTEAQDDLIRRAGSVSTRDEMRRLVKTF